jgi:hypothetical protein
MKPVEQKMGIHAQAMSVAERSKETALNASRGERGDLESSSHR